ncbi:MAG: hypothetical protein EP333_07310 [Bacteroidetes bacterium]|nr:MAG: hypothetical protein EP333_07310 [Bacteroidota bacterium]TNE96690.1 MAG: hypothetical protein EP322_08015 [Bacteroidota bacterium]
MKRVIKAFEKFHDSYQEEIYALYLQGELERATFPFKGEIAEGVIFNDEEEECTYLIPTSTIKASRLGSGDDDDDDVDLNEDDSSDLDVGDNDEDIEDEE